MTANPHPQRFCSELASLAESFCLDVPLGWRYTHTPKSGVQVRDLSAYGNPAICITSPGSGFYRQRDNPGRTLWRLCPPRVVEIPSTSVTDHEPRGSTAININSTTLHLSLPPPLSNLLHPADNRFTDVKIRISQTRGNPVSVHHLRGDLNLPLLPISVIAICRGPHRHSANFGCITDFDFRFTHSSTTPRRCLHNAPTSSPPSSPPSALKAPPSLHPPTNQTNTPATQQPPPHPQPQQQQQQHPQQPHRHPPPLRPHITTTIIITTKQPPQASPSAHLPPARRRRPPHPPATAPRYPSPAHRAAAVAIAAARDFEM
ncbi:hypothetical protein FALCPG4_006857 [Fusarium falciforme]